MPRPVNSSNPGLDLESPDAVHLSRVLFSQTDDLVVVLDSTLQVCHANPAARAALGRSAPLPLGASLDELGAVRDDDLWQIKQACLAVASGAGALPLRMTLDGGPEHGQVYRLRVLAMRDPAQSAWAVVLHGANLTDLAEVEQRLREREREFRTLAENSPDNIIRYGLDLRAVYCNQEIEERVAVEARRLLGRTAVEGAPPGMVGVEAYQAQIAQTLATGERATVELRVPTPSGEFRVHHVLIAPEYDAQGAICGAIAVGRDVTPLVRALEQVSDAEREFRTLAENADDNIVRWDQAGRMLYVNPAMSRVLGRSAESLIGTTATEAYPGGEFDKIHHAVREVHRSGQPELLELRWQPGPGQRRQFHQIRLVPERDASGAVRTVLGVGRDITDAVEQREMIASLARQDPLTRLENRLALLERANGMFAGAQRHHGKVGVLLVDLDEFKAINDGLGHSAGDELLCEVARRFADALRADDLLVRLGGDEFVVLAPDVGTPAGTARVGDKLRASLAAPATIMGRLVHVTASIGIAIFPDDGDDIERLLARADSAMYHAKRAGRARTEFYTEAIGTAVQRRLALEQALREACHGTGMHLFYQPKVVAGERVTPVGAEALLRWEHAILGNVSPCEFIPLAEDTGLIVPLGAWVFEQAARQAAHWNASRAVPFKVAVNVSARQLVEPGFAGWVSQTLRSTGCRAEWLVIEITESVFAEQSGRVQPTLSELQDQGILVSLDDFGTGFSSLSYLARFPVNELKIDRSFVQAISEGERHRELLRAFVAMAGALGLSTVAEGVETETQAHFLKGIGCTVMQGWHFGRAVAPDRFEHDWLA